MKHIIISIIVILFTSFVYAEDVLLLKHEHYDSSNEYYIGYTDVYYFNNGVTKTVSFSSCPSCIFNPKKCVYCQGTGQDFYSFNFCSWCKGTGSCSECKGKGLLHTIWIVNNNTSDYSYTDLKGYTRTGNFKREADLMKYNGYVKYSPSMSKSQNDYIETIVYETCYSGQYTYEYCPKCGKETIKHCHIKQRM